MVLARALVGSIPFQPLGVRDFSSEALGHRPNLSAGLAVVPLCTCSERICLMAIIAGTETFQLIIYGPVSRLKRQLGPVSTWVDSIG